MYVNRPNVVRAMNVKEGDVQLRFPDFIVIGAAKSGTTTLHAWLKQQPEVFMCRKEPKFFADRWDLGPEWYAHRFDDAARDALAGEISPQYTAPEYADIAAPRMADLVPDARLIYLLRHPIDRLLSHYRFRARQARVGESFDTIVAEPHNFLVEGSRYFARLSPYIDAFPREQIRVVRFEDLVATGGDGWDRVLDHLGLPSRPAPSDARNVTDDVAHVAPSVRRLGAARRRLHLPSPPRSAVRATRRVAQVLGRDYRDPFEGGTPTVPGGVASAIWGDIERLEAWLGLDAPLWQRTT